MNFLPLRWFTMRTLPNLHGRMERLRGKHTSLHRLASSGADSFGDPVVATALLDRLPHHAVVVQIDGASYHLRLHADLVPKHVRANASIKSSADAKALRVPEEGGRALGLNVSGGFPRLPGSSPHQRPP